MENKSLMNVPEGVTILAILDEDWPYFLEEKRCDVRDRVSRWEAPLVPSTSLAKDDPVFFTTIKQVPQ